jgi:hypothetical protein
MRRTLLTVLLAAACSSSATAPVDTVPTPAGPREIPLPACDQPELWLSTHARADIPDAFCAACADACEADEGPPAMTWRLLSADDAEFPCNDLAYVAHAIRGYRGVPVADEFWKPHFAAQPWYQPVDDPDDLPAAIRDNLTWIELRAAACRRDEPRPVTPEDWDILLRWFDGKDQNRPELPPKLFVNEQPASAGELLEFIRGDGVYVFTRRTSVRYADTPPPGAEFPGKTTRTIHVATGDPGVSCLGDGEDCEGYEWIDFTLDDTGAILALSVGAAG